MEISPLVLFIFTTIALAVGYCGAIFKDKIWKFPHFLEKGLIRKPFIFDFLNGPNSAANNKLQERYKEGLNSLINEQPDLAIDALTEALDITEETFDTHMALGNMLRKRGEVDRAIRIHQNLLEHGGLSEKNTFVVNLALADDYSKAGLYDRAEALYNELSHSKNPQVVAQSLEKLVDVYQHEGEWLEAIIATDKLIALQGGRSILGWQHLQAHFYCEIAEQAISQGNFSDAKGALEKAGQLDRDLARVLILKGQLASAAGEYELAFHYLRQVPLNFTAHNAQALPLLIDTFHQLLQQKQNSKTGYQQSVDLQNFLAEIYRKQPSVLLLPAMARTIGKQENESAAVRFVISEIRRWPNLEPVGDVLEILPPSASAQLSLESLLDLLEVRLKTTQIYECQSCGYEGHEHNWQCPSCQEWGSVVALH